MLKYFCIFDLPQPRSTRPARDPRQPPGSSGLRPREQHILSLGEGASAPPPGRVAHTSLLFPHLVCARFSLVSKSQRRPPHAVLGRPRTEGTAGLRRLCRCAGGYRDQPRPQTPGLPPAGPPELGPDPNLSASGPLASPQPHTPPDPCSGPCPLLRHHAFDTHALPSSRELPRLPRSITALLHAGRRLTRRKPLTK